MRTQRERLNEKSLAVQASGGTLKRSAHKKFTSIARHVRRALTAAVWVGIALIGVAWLYYTWVADPRDWLETSDHAGGVVVGVSVIWALASFLAFSRRTTEAEQKATRYRAWQTINTAQGKPGNGGRLDAVADLAQIGVSLAGVNLDGAFLKGLQVPPFANFSHSSFGSIGDVNAVLRGATLSHADFAQARMEGVDLSEATLLKTLFAGAQMSGAKLHSADAADAIFREACLDGANLAEIRLDRANLHEASLIGAVLRFAQLPNADLRRSKLRDADLKSANLRGANLGQVDLTNVSLRSADLEGAILSDVIWNPETTQIDGASLFGVHDAPPRFLEWAFANGALKERLTEASSV